MEDRIEFRLNGIDAAAAERAMEGLDVEPEQSLENLGILEGLLIVAGAAALGKFIIRIWREVRGGTVIDMTKKPPDISRDNALDYGFFVIFAQDGTVRVETKDEPEDSLERIVTSVLKLAADASIGSLKAVLEGVAPNAQVKTEPAAA
jgi:hypothetical protein